MLRSMTGFGRARREINGRDIMVEIKSVNHRYFEFSARTPRAYGFLDDKLKSLIHAVFSRGKVETNVSIVNLSGKDAEVGIDLELARGYVDSLRSLAEPLSLVDNLSLSSIARFSDIFQVKKNEEDAEVIWNEVKIVAQEALERFVSMRETEGEQLRKDIVSRLGILTSCVEEVDQLSPQTIAAYKERLLLKLNEVLEGKNIEEARVLTEVALFADKIAVDEETVRLKSHIQQFYTLVDLKEPVGKKLDFLVQEMNRETNTIGSKCQDIAVTNIVLTMKAEIEKIREQIQNIE